MDRQRRSGLHARALADHRLPPASEARSLTAVGTPPQVGVLLIEDDDDDALIVSDLLADTGVARIMARGRTLDAGLAGLGDAVGCVLLDLHLPDASGVDAVRRVRAAAPTIAVIVLTGLDDAAAGEAAVTAGAQDYLVKGHVDGPALARAIRYAIGRRQAEDVLARLRIAEIRAEENARLERGLVPHPIVSGDGVWIASRYLPGRESALVGGDFFDVVQAPDAGLHIVMGDVSGRGPDEAALGASLRIAWRALTLSDTPGDRVLETLQAVIEAERQDIGTFATLCTLRIDPAERGLVLRRAGHPAPLVVDEHSAVESLPLDGGGPPIGLFTGGEWAAREFSLPAVWSVLLYTDGLIEGHDGGDGLLGEEGLRELITARLKRSPGWRSAPSALLGEIVAEVRRRHGGPSSDDVALLAAGNVTS